MIAAAFFTDREQTVKLIPGEPFLYALPLRTFCNFPHKLSYKPHIMACEQFWEVMIWLT